MKSSSHICPYCEEVFVHRRSFLDHLVKTHGCMWKEAEEVISCTKI